MILRCCSTLIIIFHCVKEETLPPKHEFTAELLTFQPLAVSEDKGGGSPQRRSFRMAMGRGEAAEGDHRWKAVMLFALGAVFFMMAGDWPGILPTDLDLNPFACRISGYSSSFNMLVLGRCTQRCLHV